MTTIKDRNLPQRSKLLFEFPVPEQGGGKFVITLPFFENIRIGETKKANYVKYNLLSRSSQLYTYTGADSRRFNLEFVMSFPHILEEHSSNLTEYLNYVESEDASKQRDQFKPGAKKIELSLTGLAQRLTDRFRKDADRLTGEEIIGNVNEVADTTLQALLGFSVPKSFVVNTKHFQMLDLIMYWTNIIRASVTNNSENPIYGPPIVRINHGILFQNIPCICTDYSIEPLEEAGYDLGTLLPRRIRFTMNLEELRAGDFQTYDSNSANPIKRDNLVGWESVVSQPQQSMDPGYIL